MSYQTGWTGEPPDAPAAGGFAGFLQSMRAEPGPVDPLERARLAADRPDEPYDADERAANLLASGYRPGHLSDLAQRYADTMTELAGERDKFEVSRRRQERIARDHAAGRITAFDIARMEGDAGDEGDAGRVRQLERRAENLRGQLADASAMVSPQQRSPDPLEAAAQRAHRAFAETTRAMMADAEAGALRREPRPFASGGVAVRTEVFCAGEPPDAELAEFNEKVSDLVAKGYSLATARLACTPAGYR